MTRNRKKHIPKISTFSANLPVNQNQQAADSRTDQVEAVKEFSATTNVPNPYQALPATGLSRIITKKLPEDMDGIVQYYNHIDAIQATSFVEKCRILAHANSLFRNPETKKEFQKEQGSWKEFLGKIGMSHPQVSRFVSFWNIFGPNILQKTIEEDFSATKLAELLSWPEDPKKALLEEKRYPTQNGDKTVYEMTRDELREIKRMLINRQDRGGVIETQESKPMNIRIRFQGKEDALYQSLLEVARKEDVSEDEIIRRALNFYINNQGKK
ncbi:MULTISPECIES: hypothetical protein [unclassified Exiguobacterium]|uniref:hypothetical protein n=1 Tax=unclassified Exiguobacterium TaxID=2644629 RepID=UPI00103F4617|nr:MULTISPECIES: hypothetical protein [unclassified Exiguobacterium]TCI42977.1 hypothetical protein EVJ31_13315 [Exiguobacterium sp. SH5S32]TCI49687.1 hypothetical protein EVJ25_13685 [Exiguobacterium sp. SH1S4]TCI67812.1 hypothetical protein EVJ23_13420 [Exiguobacterium sp. SH1S1]